jgi:hypothetical protein
MDGSRLRSDAVGPTAARVGISSEDLAAVVYTMEAPGSKYAAGNCPVSTQSKMCKHQVAWLIVLALAHCKSQAMCLVVRMLGTLLGFLRGRSMENICAMTSALMALQPCQPQLDLRLDASMQTEMLSEAPASTPLTPSSPPAYPSSALVAGKQHAFGAIALQHHKEELWGGLQECLAALERAAPSKERPLATQQRSTLVHLHDVTVVAVSTEAPYQLRSNFAS